MKKTTHYLVAGANTGDAKRKSAEKFGTRVIDEAELARLLAEPAPDAPPASDAPTPDARPAQSGEN